MRIPIFLSANPKTARDHSGIVKLYDGEWRIINTCEDTQVQIVIDNDPLTILSAPEAVELENIKAPCYVLARITKRGTEQYFDVFAEKLNGRHT
jgi:hypothetical protein